MRTSSLSLTLLFVPVLLAGCARGGRPLLTEPPGMAREEAAALLADGLSAEDAARLALINDPASRAAILEIRAEANADYLDAAQIRNPSFHGELRYPEAGIGMANIGLDFSQEIIDLAFYPLRKSAARDRLEAADLRAAQTSLDHLFEAKSAYIEAIAAEQDLQLSRQALAAHEAAAELSQRQLAAGNVSDLEFSTRLGTYHDAMKNAAEVEAHARHARENLNLLLGLWGEMTTWTLPSQLPDLPSEDESLDGLESKALLQRADLKALGFQAEAIRKQRRLVKLLSWQDLEIGASAERETEGSWVVGPTLGFSIPLFTQGRAQRVRAKYAMQVNEAQRSAIAVKIRSEVRHARDALDTKRKVYLFNKDIFLPERQRSLDLSQQNFDGMHLGVYELLESKLELIHAERDLAESAKDYWLARLALEHALGGSFGPDASPEPSSSHH